MGKQLTADQVDHFARHGWVAPVRVMSVEAADELRERLEREEQRLGGPLSGTMLQKPHLVYSWLADLVFNDSILDAVEDLYGPDLLCWSSTLFAKEAKTTSFVSWHQDSTYWGLSRPDVVTAWCALTPSNRTNGALEVISGTHHLDQLPHHDTFAKENMLTRGQEIAVDIGDATPTVIELEPGEISLHHVRLVHGSAPAAEESPPEAVAPMAPVELEPPSMGSSSSLTGMSGCGLKLQAEPRRPKTRAAPAKRVERRGRGDDARTMGTSRGSG